MFAQLSFLSLHLQTTDVYSSGVYVTIRVRAITHVHSRSNTYEKMTTHSIDCFLSFFPTFFLSIWNLFFRVSFLRFSVYFCLSLLFSGTFSAMFHSPFYIPFHGSLPFFFSTFKLCPFLQIFPLFNFTIKLILSSCHFPLLFLQQSVFLLTLF